jgi:hypothetical protein
MVGLTITGNPIATLAVGASNSTIGTYTITQADIDAGKVVNTALLQRRSNDSNRYLWNYRDKRYPTDTPLTQTPRIALVKTAAVGGTGKVGDVITYTAVTNTGNTTHECNRNRPNGRFNDHWKPNCNPCSASKVQSKERTRSLKRISMQVK